MTATARQEPSGVSMARSALRTPPTVPPFSASSSPNRVMRNRVRTQWLVLAVALVVLAATMVAWALTRAAARVQVVAVAQKVQAGAVLTAADLTTTGVAFDQQPAGLVPASALDRLVGRVAAIDLAPGTLVTSGMWVDATALQPGERTIGALLKPGQYPSNLTAGMTAVAVSMDVPSPAPADTGTSGSGTPASTETPTGAGSETSADAAGATPVGLPVAVRVLDAEPAESGALRVTIAAAAADAATIARWAATEKLILVGVPTAAPSKAAPGTASGTTPGTTVAGGSGSAGSAGDTGDTLPVDQPPTVAPTPTLPAPLRATLLGSAAMDATRVKEGVAP